MSAVRGAVAGVLGLTMLQAIVSNQQATSNAGGLVTFVTNALARWFNPYTPLIPDLRKASAAAPGLPTTPGGHSQILQPPGSTPRLPGAPDGQGGTVPPTTTPRSSLDQQPV